MFIDPVSAQTDRDVIEVARSVLKVDRQAVLVSAMTLTGMRLAAAVPLAPVDDCK
jgi:hypothetical protein